MSTTISLNIPSITDDPALPQAIEALNAGDRVSGQRLLFKVLRNNPYNEQAWLWLSSTYRAAEQRRMCLQRVLAINPDNQAAQAGLARPEAALTASTDPKPEHPSVSKQAVATLPAVLPNPSTSTGPAWDEREMYFATRRWLLLLVALTAIVWGTIVSWIMFGAAIPKAAAQPLAPGVNLTVILSPLIIAAATVERALESVFNIIENNWHALVAYLGRGMRWLKSAETEVQRARQWLAEASGLYDQRMQSITVEHEQLLTGFTEDVVRQMDQAKSVLALAEQRLTEAEKNLAGLTLSASYKKAKATASIVLGLLLGVIVARLASLQMFAMLGLGGVPAKLDVLLTGLVIGSGSYPVHTFVGLLQQVKDTLDSAKGTLARFGRMK